MADGKRSTGSVKWFSAQKGFGFIAPDDGGEDLFVHQTSIQSDGFRTLNEGQLVEFAVDFGDDGRAKAVEVVGAPRSHRGPPRPSRGGGIGRGFYGGRGRGRGYSSGRGDGGYGRSGRGGRSSGGGGGACYNCGRFGHLARDCYQSGGNNGGSRRYGGGAGAGACYNCGEEGHFARDCPNTERN